MSESWSCPYCAHFHYDGLIDVDAECGNAGCCSCKCGMRALAFAEHVYREKFRTVPQSMSQVRRLGEQGRDREKR